MDPRWSIEQKRAAKDLFGRPLRVALAAWILRRDGEPFFLQEAQLAMAQLGEAASGVSKELKAFESHRMLATFEDGRRVYFTQTSSPYWAALQSAAMSVGLLALGKTHQV